MIFYIFSLVFAFLSATVFTLQISLGGLSIILSLFAGLCCFAISWFLMALFCWLIIALVSLTVPLNKTYDKPSVFYSRFFNISYEYLCLLAGIRCHASGLEKIPTDCRYMFVSNHRSNFDNMVECVALNEVNLAFISKPENFKIPMGRHFMVRSCYLALDKSNIRQQVSTIKRAISLMGSGVVSMGVYPEGHRSKSGHLEPFMPGCFKIAEKTQCPIVVSVIRGTERIHKNFPFRHTHVYFDVIKVFTKEDLANNNTVAISDRIHTLMSEYLEAKNDTRFI